jgi:hypothetical protein
MAYYQDPFAIDRARRQIEETKRRRAAAESPVGRYDIPTSPAGSLQGQMSGAGGPATGYIPYVPDPAATSARALASNLANLPALQGLFSGIANTYIPGATDKFAQESANINELLNPTQFIDTDRYSAEAGAARGIVGSPAAISSGVVRRDKDKLQRQLLGSQLLSSVASRGAGILPIPSFLTTPESQQQWQYLSNQLAAAPNPAEAYNLAGANAALGLRSGMRAGYGGGGGAAPGVPSFFNPPSSQPMSNAAQVVNRYAGSLGITQPQTGGGWGVLSGPNGTFTSGTVPQGELSFLDQERLGYPYGIPTQPDYVAPYMQPLLETEMDYDWTG